MNTLIIILGIFAALCLGYYLAAASYAGFGSSFLIFWLAMALVFFLLMMLFLLHRKYRILDYVPKIIRVIIVIIAAVGTIFFGTMEALVISGMNNSADIKVDYIIVLGAQVRGTRISKLLSQRIDAAEVYLNENSDCMVVCTGGQGKGEDISEAEAIKGRLIEKGIEEERIIIEDKSKSTYENLKYALEIIDDKDAKIAVVTNNFHVYRAKLLARRVGFNDVSGIAAKTKPILFINYMVREGFALAKEIVFGQ